MKYLKMLGLAAVAAMGLMAFLGASSASATTLCTSTKVVEEKTVCNVAYGPPTSLHASLTKDAKEETTARLTSPAGTTVVTCSGSTMTADLKNSSATWIEATIHTLDWTGCTSAVSSVVLSESEGKPDYGELSIMWTKGDEAEVWATRTKVNVTIAGVSCQYGAGERTKLGTMTGGEAPILHIEAEVTKTEGSFLCPAHPIWDATYVLTEPHAIHVVN